MPRHPIVWLRRLAKLIVANTLTVVGLIVVELVIIALRLSIGLSIGIVRLGLSKCWLRLAIHWLGLTEVRLRLPKVRLGLTKGRLRLSVTWLRLR